jgi:uncharacterized protein YoxC
MDRKYKSYIMYCLHILILIGFCWIFIQIDFFNIEISLLIVALYTIFILLLIFKTKNAENNKKEIKKTLNEKEKTKLSKMNKKIKKWKKQGYNVDEIEKKMMEYKKNNK